MSKWLSVNMQSGWTRTALALAFAWFSFPAWGYEADASQSRTPVGVLFELERDLGQIPLETSERKIASPKAGTESRTNLEETELYSTLVSPPSVRDLALDKEQTLFEVRLADLADRGPEFTAQDYWVFQRFFYDYRDRGMRRGGDIPLKVEANAVLVFEKFSTADHTDEKKSFEDFLLSESRTPAQENNLRRPSTPVNQRPSTHK